MYLPSDIDPKHFDQVFRLCPDEWINAALEVFAKHGIAATNLQTFPIGANLIAANATQVVKIFPPFLKHQWESERRVLHHLQSTSLPIPRLLAEGTREDGWPYVIVTRLPGVTLEVVWPQLEQTQKIDFLKTIGAMMAEAHKVPVGSLQDLDPPWKAFLTKQREQCRARHAQLGMPEWFLREVDAYVSEHFGLLRDEPPVILTGEYTPFNLLVENGKIVGMIDFADAMIGFREYDLVGPLLFLCEGDRALVKALLSGYGLTPSSELAKSLTVLSILHRYSDLQRQIRIEGWEKRVGSVSELESLIFPTTCA